MSSETYWGVWLHAVRPVAELAELAAAAEALGAAAVLVADEGTDRDLYVTLAGLAQRTRHILLVGGVTNPHSRHAVTTAAAFASLAELAPGRVVAGFGAGGSRVLDPMGLVLERPLTALRECIDVVQSLWRGEVVDHAGQIVVHGACLPWSTGVLPIAIAGRGPRVERLAAERADWVLLAGRAVERVAPLVQHLRGVGSAARGRPPRIAWNPNAAWTEAMVSEQRAHLAYMALDMPAAERTAMGLDDEHTSAIKHLVTTRGPAAATALIGDDILARYALAGARPEVVTRLTALRQAIQPELLVFDAQDYSVDFLEQVASVALDAGAIGLKNGETPYALDSHDRA